MKSRGVIAWFAMVGTSSMGCYKSEWLAAEDALSAANARLAEQDASLARERERVAQLNADITKLRADLSERDRLILSQAASVEEFARKLKEIEAAQAEAMVRMAQMVEDLKYAVDNGMTISVQNQGDYTRLVLSLPESVLFTAGEWKLTDKGTSTLTKQIDIMKTMAKISGAEIDIVGHTDDQTLQGAKRDRKGKPLVDNYVLGADRAEEIKSFLTQSNALSPLLFGVWSRSKYAPVCSVSTTLCRDQNRRVEFHVRIPKKDMDTLRSKLAEKGIHI